jgi:hypothetical protein
MPNVGMRQAFITLLKQGSGLKTTAENGARRRTTADPSAASVRMTRAPFVLESSAAVCSCLLLSVVASYVAAEG